MLEFVYANGTIYQVSNPISLANEKGNVVVKDKDGVTHVIVPGFIVLRTKENTADELMEVVEQKEEDNNEED